MFLEKQRPRHCHRREIDRPVARRHESRDIVEPVYICLHINGREMLTRRGKRNRDDHLHADKIVFAQEQKENVGPRRNAQGILQFR